MPWRGPEFPGDFPSLGWVLLDLFEEFLRVPGGLLHGQPMRLTDSQASFFVRLYALDPEAGRRIYRKAVKRGSKGVGKSPGAGAPFAFGELVGPVVFDGWDAVGEPVGRPRPAPWVQIAACSEDQTDNTYVALFEMLRDAPAIDEFNLDLGMTRIYLGDRPGRVEPVTAAAGSREGQPITAAVKDETHLWVPSNGGRRLSATLDRNLAKMDCVGIETTNAHVRGAGSVSEETRKAWGRGQAGILYDSVEPPVPDDLSDRKQVRAALEVAYGDSALERGGFVDLDRIVEEMLDPSVTLNDKLRYYLNVDVDDDDHDHWLADVPDAFPACRSELGLPDDAPCVMAWDMSLRHDSTSVGVFGRNQGRVVARVRVFNRDPATGKIDFLAVRDHVQATAVACQVTAIGYDPRYLEFEAQELADDGLPMVEFPQSPERMAPACGHLRELIVSGVFAHDGDPDLTAHVVGAVKRETDRGFTLSKGKSRRPIDAAVVCAMGAALLTEPAPATPGYLSLAEV